MKRYLFIVPFVLLPLIILLFYGCPTSPTTAVEKPTITVHTAVSEGASLELHWTDNTENGSDIFYVYAGSALVDSTTELQYTIDGTNRASSVGVTAWLGDEESGEASLDLSLTPTSNLIVYSTADPDPDHPSFVKFSNGHAVAVPESIGRNEATFYINNDIEFESIQRWPNVGSATDDPGFADASSPYNFAPGTGNYSTLWPESGSMAINATYYIWIDRSPPNSIGVEDNFAKIYVVSIDGNKVTLNISYQNEYGLRWLVD